MTQYYLYANSDVLMHHGILGQKWGVRRYQNADGTLTEAGKNRLSKYKEKQTRQLDKHYGRKIAQTIKYQEGTKKSLAKAKEKGKDKRVEKLNARLKALKTQEKYQKALHKLESDKVRKMKLSDMDAEKTKVGKTVAGIIAMDIASITIGTLVGAPLIMYATPNANNIKSDIRISQDERNKAAVNAGYTLIEKDKKK